jgi:hypothetical protein
MLNVGLRCYSRCDLDKYERREGTKRRVRRPSVPWGRDSLPYLRMICEYARAMGRLLRERDGQDSPWIPGHLKHGKYSSGQPQIYRPRQP